MRWLSDTILFYVPIKGGKCYQLNCALPSFERCILTWEMLKYENAHLRVDEIRYLDPVPASPRKRGMMLWLIRNFLRGWDWSSVLPALVPPLPPLIVLLTGFSCVHYGEWIGAYYLMWESWLLPFRYLPDWSGGGWGKRCIQCDLVEVRVQ